MTNPIKMDDLEVPPILGNITYFTKIHCWSCGNINGDPSNKNKT